jgi:hypothetical protein
MISLFIFISNMLYLNLTFYEFIINLVSTPVYTLTPNTHSVFLNYAPFNNN